MFWKDVIEKYKVDGSGIDWLEGEKKEKEIESLVQILRRVLDVDPRGRPGAKEVQEWEWRNTTRG